MDGLIIGLIIAGVIILIILALVGMYNSLVKARNRVEQSFADMDVVLKQRYDLIPNLVEVVKGYAQHESEVFEKVTDSRSRAISSNNINEQVEANKEMSSYIRKIFAISENYPKLQANTNFLELQSKLSTIEEKISFARKSYNEIVTNYNSKLEVFPTVIFAKIFKFKKYNLFEIVNPEERENVKISF